LTRRPVVLVVEDEALIRLSAVQIVEEAGYEVLEASDADEAITLLKARSDIRLVFTDVHMPGTLDGLKLAHYIRNRWPPVRLIVASGVAILSEGELPSGASFFRKPYMEHVIVDEMRRLLA
jgi:two-component system, response regulator PdtaR